MSDTVREFLLARSGVDDPASAAELPLPRLRFELAVEGPLERALDTAVSRAAQLTWQLQGPLQLRVVHWGDAEVPLAEWFPDAPITWDERPSRDGVPRRVATLVTEPTAGGVLRALSCALRGEQEIDLWILSADGVLLRPYDDRGADVVAASARVLAAIARAHPDWLLERPPPEVRCSLAACNEAWSDMAPTARPDVRRCGGCDRDVYLVGSPAAFEAHAREGHCVALPLGDFPLHVLDESPLPRGFGPGPVDPGLPPPPERERMLSGAPLPVRNALPDSFYALEAPPPRPEGVFARLRRWFDSGAARRRGE